MSLTLASPTPLLSPDAPDAPDAPDERSPVLARQLQSGRSLMMRAGSEGEELEIRSPLGELELRITLTAAGPVVSLCAARLELLAPAVDIRCDTFQVHATSNISLESDGEVRVHADELRAVTEQDIHLNGAFVRINCTPEGTEAAMLEVAALALLAEAPPENAGEACGHHHHAPAEPTHP